MYEQTGSVPGRGVRHASSSVSPCRCCWLQVSRLGGVHMVATCNLTGGVTATTQAPPEVLQPGVQRQQRDPCARRVQGQLQPLQRLQDAAPQQPLAVCLPATTRGGGGLC